MQKLKVHNRFWVTPNQLLNDPNISWKAKGIYWYLQSKPDDWDYAVDRITRDAKDGRDSTGAGIQELENAWYLVRRKFKNEKGQWEVEYELFDEPTFIDGNEESDEKTTPENPEWIWSETTPENPLPENPLPENPEIKKERNTKKEIQKNIYISNDFLNDLILEFIENRKQLKKPMTALAITKLVNKCIAWQKVHKNEIIKTFFDRAIECGWAGVFEQKQNTQTVSGQKTGWIDYAWEKEKTLKREADANKAKQDEENAIWERKRYDAMAISWFSKLPDGDLKNKINKEIDENLTIKKWFEVAETYPEWSLMREQKMESAINQRERLKIVAIRKYYETARELAR